MSKKVVVLFSGGLDSTYLIWKNLKEGNTVYPIYIEIKNNKYKSILEKNRIKLLHKEFCREFNSGNEYYSKLKDINYVLSAELETWGAHKLRFHQIPIWILGILYSQGFADCDEIQIGYVSNDDAISYLDDINTIYKSYQVIAEPLSPLVFPLVKVKKHEIVRELPSQYLKLVVSCECPKIISSIDAEYIEYEACCECTPCSHIISEDYFGTAYSLKSYPEPYHKNLLRKYISKIRNEQYRVVDINGNDFKEYDVAKKLLHQLVIDFDGVNYSKEEYLNKVNG